MTALQLHLLGGIELLDSAGHRIALPSKKSRALLAILAASHTGAVSRQRLTNLLWGSRQEEQARSSLRQTLASLRRELGFLDHGILSVEDGSVSLNQAKVTTDIRELERLARSAELSDLRSAFDLYRGPFLADSSITENEFEDWARTERARIHAIIVAVAEKLWAGEAKDRRVAAAKALLNLEPLSEIGHQAVMQSYAEMGESSLALQHYSACCKLLKDELGIAPGGAIEAIRQKILDQNTIAAATKGVGGTRTSGGRWLRDDSPVAQLAPALPNRPSIAVLPFANLSAEAEQEYFVDGMAEEIITALSRFSWLFVIARNSTFSYKGQDFDHAQVGRELGVRYLLEGTVRRAGLHVRISGRLVDVALGINLWADQFDGDLSDVFHLQESIAARVAGMLAPRLEQAEIERARQKPTASLDAYDYYLRGVAAVANWERRSNADALANLYCAIELDPEFALAYALAARCFVQRRAGGWSIHRHDDVAEASRLARLAIDLGPNDAVVLALAGFALGDVADEVEDADAYLDRSLALNANLAQAWVFSGWIKISRGEPEIAVQRLRQAMRLSPQDPHVFTMHAAMGFAEFFLGDYVEATSWAEAAMRVKPILITKCIAAVCASAAGKPELAAKRLAQMQAEAPWLTISNLSEIFSYLRPKQFEVLREYLRQAGLGT